MWFLEENFTKTELEEFISNNQEKLKISKIDFKYFKIKPSDLVGSNDYNELFFKKITIRTLQKL